MGKPVFNRRKKPFKFQMPVFYVYCEGKNTEPEYLSSFKINTVKIKPLGLAQNTLNIVEEAIKRIKSENFDKTLDQKWCVFDKDDFPANSFDNAIKKAENNGFKVAWSNQSFEYWFLLHFEDHQGGSLHRDSYKDKINKYITNEKAQYNDDGKKKITDEFFRELSATDPASGNPRLTTAINRARRNHNNKIDIPPSASESCTTVYTLVEILLKLQNN